MQTMSLKSVSRIRNRLRTFFESMPFHKFMTSLIVINSIVIGLETSTDIMAVFGTLLHIIDSVILVLFVAEITLKLFVYRNNFFQDSWNVFDFFVVALSLVPAAGSLSVFRTLRIIRTLRLLHSIPKLRFIIESLVKALSSIGWISVLLVIVFYIFSVIGVNLFGSLYPEFFGSMSKAAFTLFQIMTLESWSTAIARPVMDGVPYSGIYFISFILIATYTTLNIFIAIVVNTMNEVSLRELQAEEDHIKDFVKEQNAMLQDQLSQIQDELVLLREQRAEELQKREYLESKVLN